MNINIIAVGGIKEKFFKDACGEYAKRISRFGKLNIYEVKECRGGDMQDIEAEGELILKKIPPSSYVAALCIEGKEMPSEKLAELVSDIGLNGYGSITFIIGGSDGMSERVKKAANIRISFSKLTFPHQMMRVFLLEQIYRCFKINNNESYHK